MRHLLLLRHAEAEAVRPDISDFDRALTAQGRDEALAAAHRLQELAPPPDALLVSPAVRTRETASILVERLGLACQPHYPATLYQAAPEALLEALQATPPVVRTLLLVAHNPGLSALIRELAGPGVVSGRLPGDLASLELRPAGLCRLDVETGDWANVGPPVIRGLRLEQ